jgi:repressor LexA
MQTITKRQKEILDFIRDYIYRHDYAPTFREIAEKFSLRSVATISEHVDTLKSRGYLQKEPTLARSIQLTPTFEERTFEIPLLGTIAAGEPIEAIRTSETIDVPKDMAGPNVFALKVRGDSMVDEGIYDGDYVIIEKITNPKNGDIVVALIDREFATLKKFYKEKTRIKLAPASANHKPIYSKKVMVQGRVKGVIRKFKK